LHSEGLNYKAQPAVAVGSDWRQLKQTLPSITITVITNWSLLQSALTTLSQNQIQGLSSITCMILYDLNKLKNTAESDGYTRSCTSMLYIHESISIKHFTRIAITKV